MKRIYPCVLSDNKTGFKRTYPKSYNITNNDINELIIDSTSEESNILNFGTSAFKNVGENLNDIPTNKDVIKLVNKSLNDSTKDIIFENKISSLIKQIIEVSDKSKMRNEKNKELIEALKNELNQYVLKKGSSPEEFSWVDNSLNVESDEEVKIPTKRAIREYIDKKERLKEDKLNLIVGSLNQTHNDVKEFKTILINAANKTLFMKIEDKIIPIDFHTLRKFLEIKDITASEIKNNRGLLKDDITQVWDIEDDSKIPTQKVVLNCIQDILKLLTLDHIKEGEVNKFFNGKTLDNIEDGEKFYRLSKGEKEKLSKLDSTANKTDSSSVKKSGAVMRFDENASNYSWVSKDMNIQTDDKIPTQKVIKDYIIQKLNELTLDDIKSGDLFKHITPEVIEALSGRIYDVTQHLEEYQKSIIQKITNEMVKNEETYLTKNITSDDLVEGVKNKYFNGKTTDNLPSGKINKYLTDKTTSDNLKEGKNNLFFNNKTTDNLPEGITNKYFNGKTTDDLIEGVKNKWNRIPDHNNVTNIQGGQKNEYNHLNNKQYSIIQSIEDQTPLIIYVATDGKDLIENGKEKEKPYKTISFALSQIPQVLNTDICIYLTGEFNQSIFIDNIKSFVGNHTITFIGMFDEIKRGLIEEISNKDQGLLKLESKENYKDKLIILEGNDNYYFIDSHEFSTIKICGKWDDDITYNGNYKIYDLKTNINSDIIINNSNVNIEFKRINFKQNVYINNNQTNTIIFDKCVFDVENSFSKANVNIKNCLFKKEVEVKNNSIVQFFNSKLVNLYVSYMSNVKVGSGCIFSEQNNRKSIAIICTKNSIINLHSDYKRGLIIIKNYHIALEASINSSIINTENINFINILTMIKNPILFSNGFID